MQNTNRGSFGGRLGIILASAGSAVGLGNIWRFPTEVGRNGGAAFILVYLCFVFFLAMPVMVSEFIIGRASKANTVDSYRRLSSGKPWVIVGFLGVLGGFLVLSFYSVVAGWTLNYLLSALGGQVSKIDDSAVYFTQFTSNPWMPLMCMIAVMLMCHWVIVRGVQAGIERYSKLLMPLL